jgi:hypothetical protein
MLTATLVALAVLGLAEVVHHHQPARISHAR